MTFFHHMQNRLIALTLILVTACTQAQTPAFDGAMGFGKYTQGGNHGKVLVVTSLGDNGKDPQEGTLRWAVKQDYPRLVVFAVSGVIELEKTLEIKEPNITIAGQTSPKGIVISGASTSIEADQVIVRYLAFRPGHHLKEGDALNARNHSDIIIDHCSLSWANDEVGSFYNNTRFTLQNSLISESLNNAGHHKGSHGYGGIWGGRDASFLRNVLVSHISRNPRLNGWRLKSPYAQEEEFVDLRNNVIANWKSSSAYGSENGKANIVANYYVPGPATKAIRFFELWGEDEPLAKLYFADNVMVGEDKLTNDNLKGVKVKGHKHGSDTATEILAKSISPALINEQKEAALHDSTLSAKAAWDLLITKADVGANRHRETQQSDPEDTRVLQHIQQNQFPVKNGIIDSELEVMNWADYKQYFVAEETASPTNDEGWRRLAGIKGS